MTTKLQLVKKVEQLESKFNRAQSQEGDLRDSIDYLRNKKRILETKLAKCERDLIQATNMIDKIIEGWGEY